MRYVFHPSVFYTRFTSAPGAKTAILAENFRWDLIFFHLI